MRSHYSLGTERGDGDLRPPFSYGNVGFIYQFEMGEDGDYETSLAGAREKREKVYFFFLF